jgi:aspartate/methionine/tyrosine aminotransferase
MFSSRLPPELAPNALSRAVERARRSGTAILNLTETNPTAVGLPYPDDLLQSLADPRSRIYRPDSLGMVEARNAIASDYAARGTAGVDASRTVLTASTSEAYAMLFKLLADPGDAVLVPRPSYPLFELLTRLDGVDAAPYLLQQADDWTIDRDSVTRSISAKTRAILVVSPNNPTGSMLRSDDREWLVATAREHDLVLVSDEVFVDYPISPRPGATSLADEHRVLTFTLGGLSKSVGLPQVKLAWIVVSGPDALVAQAIERLGVIADSYLSVSMPVQTAASRLLEGGRVVRDAIATRIRRNLDQLRAVGRVHPSLTVLVPEGGWSTVVRVPATETEEALVLRLLDDAGVLVHPGYFFDFAEEAFLVLSLLPPPDVFDEAIRRIAATVEGAQIQ